MTTNEKIDRLLDEIVQKDAKIAVLEAKLELVEGLVCEGLKALNEMRREL